MLDKTMDRRSAIKFLMATTLGIGGLASAGMLFAEAPAASAPQGIADVIAAMSLEDKIAQMIIVGARTWNGTDLTDLGAADGLAAALRRHPYGGFILYSTNVKTTEQTAQLVCDLQTNNAQASRGGGPLIPYFMSVDEEGGVVTRFTTGTRMTGSMAIGATGPNALDNAEKTGQVLGKECAALGFSIDFAPDIDVNSNPANPAIGTRAFSDDPEAIAPLGIAFSKGLANNGVIGAYKHFPGHGDTSTDTHIATASVEKDYAQLSAYELIPFKAVAADADMIMTAHITLPKYDDEVTFADGTTGFYPATMSKKVMSDLLRGEIGFKGVVITDALEMDAMRKGHLVPGEVNSVEYGVNIAEKVIGAGVDILLLPADMVNDDVAAYYDGYIAGIAAKVREGAIPAERIDESVGRILALKQKYNVFDLAGGEPNFQVNPDAASIVGSAEHHSIERAIAQQAITLVKNDGPALPISGNQGKIVLLGRLKGDTVALAYAVRDLQQRGLIDKDARVCNLCTGVQEGSEESPVRITIDYYCGFDDKGAAVAHYTDDLAKAISEARTVVCLTASYSAGPLAATSPLYQSVSRAIQQTHEAGGAFVLMVNNLPYDAARYQDADAIMLGYMTAGMDVDPATGGAYNANLQVAISLMFGDGAPAGKLPVAIPAIQVLENGSIAYTDQIIYERGYGLSYA